MGNYICLNNIIITILTTLLFVSCKPAEPMLELQLEGQMIGEPFSFADYCEEEYDSIFLVYPYFNTEKESFVNLKMSDKLRRVCNSNSNFDSFSTLLFINDGEVNAFSEINFGKIRLTAPEIPENKYIFPFEQKFILDENRYVHIYEE
ncbi:MAG: hypothetical protein IJ513_04105 [Bacteroidaceae bacterium]|nr:hypothetical protein [Bacteroidaceae bacterium]